MKLVVFFIGTYVTQLSLLGALHKVDIECVTLKKNEKEMKHQPNI